MASQYLVVYKNGLKFLKLLIIQLHLVSVLCATDSMHHTLDSYIHIYMCVYLYLRDISSERVLFMSTREINIDC